ncbi:MAG: hypothetical protein H7647_02470 [Candidatus Heimdallarchaeota archaeon]|nr:hypothetical protein [Candidatus Heimdallarchaeota archaeon]MCK4253292.1 hypothetical protein [Candidatus Heimdallarchaeota archaeon]
MLFPEIDISPLVAIIIYDTEGANIFTIDKMKSEIERIEVNRYFVHPIEFYQWVRRYSEITIFRGKFRATYVTFIDLTILFVSRVENFSLELRPLIKDYIEVLGNTLLNSLNANDSTDLIELTCKSIMAEGTASLRNKIESIFDRFGIEKPKFVITPAVRYPVMDGVETRVETFEKIKPFETVPMIPVSEMTKEILDEANKRATTSLLFSSIRSCDSPSAAAYIFPKEQGSMGQLYAGNLEEKKIIYVLETLTKYPRVIFEMIQSEEEIKFLNAGVVQIIVESCLEGKILVGMTTNVNDVMNVAYKFKIIKHILDTMGF